MLSEQELALLVFVLSLFIVLGYIVLVGVCRGVCRCFAWLQRETSRNILVTRFMEEMLYCVPPVNVLFFHGTHFHHGGL